MEPGKEINDNHDNRGHFPQILDFLFSPFCQLSFLRGRRALSSHISPHDVMQAIGNVWNDYGCCCLVLNVLNAAKRLNGWNGLNGQSFLELLNLEATLMTV
jgi:hypothetical protein